MASATRPHTGHSEEGNPGGDHHEHPAWFQIESFTTVEMQTRLRAAMGMCAAHVYRLIEGTGEGHLMTTVMRHTVSGARERLGGETPHSRSERIVSLSTLHHGDLMQWNSNAGS